MAPAENRQSRRPRNGRLANLAIQQFLTKLCDDACSLATSRGMTYLDLRFFPVQDLIDPVSAYTGSYNAGLVALSIIVATLAAFVALSISGRIVAANSRA